MVDLGDRRRPVVLRPPNSSVDMMKAGGVLSPGGLLDCIQLPVCVFRLVCGERARHTWVEKQRWCLTLEFSLCVEGVTGCGVVWRFE